MIPHMATMKPYILAEYGMSSGLSGVRYNRLTPFAENLMKQHKRLHNIVEAESRMQSMKA